LRRRSLLLRAENPVGRGWVDEFDIEAEPELKGLKVGSAEV
jgi:hypothetical protein